MFKNYLKVALRSLMRRPAYALINILGLTTGVACCLLIYLYISNELNMDSFHQKGDRIYRVVTDAFPPSGEADYFAVSSRPIGNAIRTEYAEVESLVRLTRWGPVVKKNGEYFNDDTFYFAEPSFFDVFTFPLLEGDAATALTQINSLVITEEMQTKYFGNESALGKTLTLNDTSEFTITGVLKNVPNNSHFTFDFLVSYENNLRMFPETDDWLSLNSFVYLVLKEQADATAFAEKVKTVLMDKYGEELLSFGFKGDVIIQPLNDIYLKSKRKAEIGVTGDLKYVYVFSLVGAFVLIIACINFMNLATARSVERAKEVGLRKVSGSSRGLLISQFLTESMILTMISVVLSLLVVLIALPFFNDVANKEISFLEIFRPDTLLIVFGIILVVGLAAGAYPAFALSSFKITDVIKGSFKSNPRAVVLRKGLVVFQFMISIILMVVTAIAFRQFNYMQTKDLGFDKEQILVLNASGIPNNIMDQKYVAAKAEFDRIDAVTSVAASSSIPGRGTAFLLTSLDGIAEDDVHGMNMLSVDNDFFTTFGIHLQSGRHFKSDGVIDVRTSTIVTESVYKIANWKTAEEVLNKNLSFGGPNLKIVGVVDNFHYYSLKQPLSPIVFTFNPSQFNYFSCKVKMDNVDATIAQLKTQWEAVFPGYSFDYFFLDQDFKNQYESEQNVIGIFTTFTTIANIIACLGLFGLAAYTVTQRTKEIGVRKVLGASVPQVVMLLSKDFTRLVIIAYLISLPLAYYLSEQWLKEFPYRIDTDYAIYVISGIVAFTVAWLTVSYQSLMAAKANPVNSLKSE